ncbi:MAG: methyltransferase domain-containing protein [bacterium]
MDKRIIDKFSKYYRGGEIQKKIGENLIALISDNFHKVLEIGCGDGQFTRMFKERFGGRIISLDVSEKMVSLAKNRVENVKFVVADGEALPFKVKEGFDLIVSNVCFQWFNSLACLEKYKNFLSKDGVLLFSIFGKTTLNELAFSLNELFKDDVKIKALSFPSKEEIEEILRKIFRDYVIKDEVIKKEYGSIMELLLSIRYSSSLNRKMLWTKGILERLDRIYRDKFNTIFATYEVFLCKGQNTK